MATFNTDAVQIADSLDKAKTKAGKKSKETKESRQFQETRDAFRVHALKKYPSLEGVKAFSAAETKGEMKRAIKNHLQAAASAGKPIKPAIPD